MYYHNYNIKQDIRFGEGVEYKNFEINNSNRMNI